MSIDADRSETSRRMAESIIRGFDRHYRLFRECTASAKERFEKAEWLEGQRAMRERIQFYDDRVRETIAVLQDEFDVQAIDDAIWQQAKLLYIGLLINHKQPELAETFFNSVFCQIMHRTYFHNDFIFVRPAASTEYIESDPPTYRCYYPNAAGFRASIKAALKDVCWAREFEDLDRDVERIALAARQQLGELPRREANFQIQVLNAAFYRNKAAYIIGKVVNGSMEYPFTIPVLHSREGRLYLDTVILDSWRIAVLFSLSRAYFMVDMDVPSAYVQFLRTIMPNKPRSEIYTMLGLGKQGKTMFFRDLFHHLHHSEDQFAEAPGIRGDEFTGGRFAQELPFGNGADIRVDIDEGIAVKRLAVRQGEAAGTKHQDFSVTETQVVEQDAPDVLYISGI